METTRANVAPKPAAENSEKNSEKRRGNPENLKPYRFKPGESGNPGGRPKSPFADAARRVAVTRGNSGRVVKRSCNTRENVAAPSIHLSGKPVTRPFESLPVLLTVTRDQQIAQLGFVPSRMEARLIP